MSYFDSWHRKKKVEYKKQFVFLCQIGYLSRKIVVLLVTFYDYSDIICKKQPIKWYNVHWRVHIQRVWKITIYKLLKGILGFTRNRVFYGQRYSHFLKPPKEHLFLNRWYSFGATRKRLNVGFWGFSQN